MTKADLRESFNAAEVSNASPADATFLILDQNFHRNNDYISKWTYGGSGSFSTTMGSNYYNGMGSSDERTNGQYFTANIYR